MEEEGERAKEHSIALAVQRSSKNSDNGHFSFSYGAEYSTYVVFDL